MQAFGSYGTSVGLTGSTAPDHSSGSADSTNLRPGLMRFPHEDEQMTRFRPRPPNGTLRGASHHRTDA